MDPNSPGFSMPPSNPPQGPANPAAQEDSRVIRVVSRDDSPPPESLPFAQSWGSSSRPRCMPLSQQSRSRSMTDVRGSLRKNSRGLFHNWKKDDSKILPSCQINPRRSPLGGKTCRSPTTAKTPDLIRRDSISSNCLGRQSAELERSLSAELASPAASQQRNKSDSGIVSDDFLLSLSGNSENLREAGLTRRCHDQSSHPKHQSVPDTRHDSVFEPVCDTDSQSNTYSSLRFSDAVEKSRPRRHRNHSESEICNPPTPGFDDDYFSDSASSKHIHRSLESLNCLKGNATILPDFRPGSFGAPVTDVESARWSPALRPDSRTDSMEHLNCGGSWRDPESADNDDDVLNASWSSTGWRKSVISRCSESSDGSAYDVFSDSEDRVGDISDALQNYSASKLLGCERDSGIVTSQTRRATHGLQRKDDISKSSLQTVKSTVKAKNNIPDSHHAEKDDNSAKKRGTQLSKSPTHTNVKSERSQTVDQNSKSVPDEQLNVYKPSESSSVLLPHLQKTLAAVRKHIKSKKSSGSASKNPANVRHQISPNRRTSRSADSSRDLSRRSSSASSTNSVTAEQTPQTSQTPSENVVQGSSERTSPSVRDRVTADNSILNSKVLVSTAVTLANAQAFGDSNERRKSGDGSTVDSVDPSCLSDKMLSVFSPRPPRLQGEDNASPQPTTQSNNIDSSQGMVESLRPEVPKMPNKTFYHSEDGGSFQTSPRKNESSPGKSDLSRRDKAKVVSPRNRVGEHSTFRKNKRKTSSRVDYILNNDLFRKHLSGHIDLVEKNVLQIKKFGLKKSFSNLDLTVTDSEKLQAAFESSLKLQDIDLDGSFSDDSKPVDTTSAPKQDSLDPQERNLKPTTDQNNKSKSSSDETKTPRRKSIACDDPSMHQLREAFRQGKTFSETQVTVTKRNRVHIPSYDEFRKQRQKERAMRPADTNSSPAVSSAGKGDDNLDGLMANYRTLDTITEDDGTDTARSATGAAAAPIVPTINIEHVEDDTAPEPIQRKLASVEPPTCSDYSNVESESEQKMSSPPHRRKPRNDARQDDASLEILKQKNSEKVPENKTHLTHPIPKRSSSAKNLSIDSNTGKLEREHSPAIPRNKAQLTHPKPKRASSAKDLSTCLGEKQTVTTNSLQSPNDRNLPMTGFNDRRGNGSRSATEITGGDANTESPDKFEAESTIDFTRESGSGSSDATMQDDFSDGETDPDDVYQDQESCPGAGNMVERDNLYSLFDDRAVALDTEAWSRLFTQTHKSRRREDHHKHRRHHHPNSKEEKLHTVPVLRSSSDVTGLMTNNNQSGQRKRRLRKERPYKSDPFADVAGTITYNDTSDCANTGSGSSEGRPGEVGAMPFLEQGSISRDSKASSFPSLEELTEVSSNSEEDSECDSQDEGRSKKRLSNISTVSEDSGVMGQEGSSVETSHAGPQSPQPYVTSVGLRTLQVTSCFQCKPSDLELRVETSEQDTLLCDKCLHHQQERRDTIYEIIETEINYGRDLRILKEEFLVPMQTTGLLTAEQLQTVFTNLDDLISINTQLTEKLRATLHNSVKDCDQNLNLVNIGSLFVESSTMFLAFESYCINQAQAQASLEQLERERELLRIFLQVSQTENGLLRRMHLKSFLMVPVQRIMKYPLLLNRLYKATPAHHVDKEDIRQAREKIEDILSHINAKTKGTGSVFIKRKQSEVRRYSLAEKIEVNRVALEVLGWSKKEVCDLITSRLWYAQPPDHTWAAKRCRNVKFTRVHAVLFTLGQKRNDNMNFGQQAAVVLVREKNGKYQAIRDPFLLDKSVVTVDPDCDDVFELQEWGREAYIFKADGLRETHAWIQHLRQQTHNLGQWRRRRNALPNIMLKNV